MPVRVLVDRGISESNVRHVPRAAADRDHSDTRTIINRVRIINVVTTRVSQLNLTS